MWALLNTHQTEPAVTTARLRPSVANATHELLRDQIFKVDPPYATPEGTRRFAARHTAPLAAGLYRETSTGLSLSSIGIGTYLGDADDRTDALVIEAVKRSVAAGMNVIDTASNYRKGRAEIAVGVALSELFGSGLATRSELFISTKAGFVASADLEKRSRAYGATSADFDPSGRHCVAPARAAGVRAGKRGSRDKNNGPL